MKRTFLTLAFVFSFGSMAALAQTSTPAQPQITVRAGETVQSALNAIISCAGLKGLSLDDGANFAPLPTNPDPKLKSPALTSAVVVQACNSWSGMMAAIKQVLPSGFDFAIDQSGILHVRPTAKVATPVPGTTATTPTATTVPDKPKDTISLSISEPARIRDLVFKIADGQKLNISNPSQLTGTWDGVLQDAPLQQALNTITSNQPYSLMVEDNTIKHMPKPQTAAEPRLEPRTTPATTSSSPIQSQPSFMGLPLTPDGLVVMPNGSLMTRGDLDQDLRLNPNLLAENLRQMAQVRQNVNAEAGYYTSYAGNAVSGMYGGNGLVGGNFLNPFAYRDIANAEKYGLLKIDGPDRFLQKVRVVIDGRDMAVASKSNNKWNKAVLLTAGSHTIEFVLEESVKGKPQILAFRRDVDIIPMSVQYSTFRKAEPTWLRVSGNEFNNGREVYEYQQHRYVETTNGKFEPK